MFRIMMKAASASSLSNRKHRQFGMAIAKGVSIAEAYTSAR
jgi:hypothetical protein